MEDAKLAELKAKIKEKTAEQEKKLLPKDNIEQKNSAKLANMAIEIISIPIAATIFGYIIDKYLHTYPIFLLICLCFGIISSVVNCYKIMK